MIKLFKALIHFFIRARQFNNYCLKKMLFQENDLGVLVI